MFMNCDKTKSCGEAMFLPCPVWSPRLLAILRMIAALLFIEHGTMKLFDFPLSDHGTVELMSMMGLAGLLELAGGVFLFLGAFTKPVAFLLSGEMAFAYFIAHYPKSFYPALNGGDGAILFCFVFLYIAVAGGGAWSLDNFMRRCYTRKAVTAPGPDEML